MRGTDHLSDRSTFHRMRSEQERERRRMRDRERRQSMTSEQRERHLARRRWNYQLRRQRVKHLESGFQPGCTNTILANNMTGMNHLRLGGYNPKSLVHFGYVMPIGSGQVLFKVHGEHSLMPKGKEPLAYDLTKLQSRLRLVHVKQFARSLKSPLGELAANNIPILADLIMKGNQVSCGKPVHVVRLNRVKELARGMKCSASKEAPEQIPSSKTEGSPQKRNLPSAEGHQPAPPDEARKAVTVA
ncbi:hypothetical protein MLD38_021052 [Melastoma candidum]|uniref:Uncharacterized protein n=1 Tax=Melastoma candidum TaxID=119954 RepID=A0ACB9QFE3_9MYRT|nr:hypothetical protein MLD38_021052 [Melastoma candidum]